MPAPGRALPSRARSSAPRAGKCTACQGRFSPARTRAGRESCSKPGPTGGDEALARILWLHASTRERLPLSQTDALFARIFAQTGRPERVLDIACGLNPIYLGARSLAVTGVGRAPGRGGACQPLRARKRPGGARGRSATCWTIPCRRGGFAWRWQFKLLPLLGADGARLLARLEADFVAVSFPTRTLGGRSVGMERNYAQAFEAQIPPRYAVCERFVAGGELIYLLKER